MNGTVTRSLAIFAIGTRVLCAGEPPAPLVTGSLVGSPQAVFDTANSCEQIDIPDASAHAFRDDHDVVHLIATHFVARAMLGPSLDKLRHDCNVIYRSPQDTDPSHFQYDNWLYSFYTIDGRHVAALVHSEYHGDGVSGECATPQYANNCWWNTITFAQSFDGGLSFTEPRPPLNLVASLPYRYQVGNTAGAVGYYQPTNILKVGSYFYAMINDWPYKAQKYGPCLMRTRSIFDPGTWRAWDGAAFTIRFENPYEKLNRDVGHHVCEPVFAGVADSLVQLHQKGIFIVLQFTPDDRFGPPGLYVCGSRDLIRWSRPTLLARTSDLAARDGPGNWSYGYGSLLDPASTDRNFTIISDAPFVYFVRTDRNHAPYARVLFRQQIKLRTVD